jgi:hypothetical protein
MSSKILIKRSTTSGSVPTTSDLDTGELGLNTADKRVYTNNAGTIVELGTYPSSLNVTGNTDLDGTLNVDGASTLASGTVSGNWTVTGTLTVSTPTNSTDAASKGYVDTAVANVIDSAPAALDTLNELAAALNDDANFATTVTTALATKLPLAGGTMTGDITLGANKITSTATPATDDTLTRKGYVDSILGSATDAATSASAAASSESNAAYSEVAAATSATEASSSAIAAASSASAASTSETNAATSASSASTSATAAATSATNAATSATNAAASYDAFDDRYLGSKSSAPSVDNDGDALLTGALYFDTTAGGMYVYTGSAWEAAYSGASGTLTAANNLSDLDNAATARTNLGLGTAATTDATDYVATTGDSMTGNLSFGDNDKAMFGAGNDLQIFHNGTNNKSVIAGSVIDPLEIHSNAFSLKAGLGGPYTMLTADVSGSVDLYYADVKKFETTAQGVSVTGRATGTVTTDNDLSFDMSATNNFSCTPSGTGTLTFTNITSGQSGNIYLDNSGGHVISAAATTFISAADLTKISTAGKYFVSYYSADGTNVLVSASSAVTASGA